MALLLGVAACSGVAREEIDPALVGATGGDSTLFPDSGNGGYDVIAYDWDLVVSDDLSSLEGTATITATATQGLQQFSLDSRGLNIRSVAVGGEEAEFSVEDPELIITLAEPLSTGEEFAVTVSYHAEPELFRPEGLPFFMGWDVSTGRLLLVHGFPGAEATWVPTNGVRYDPVRYTIRLDVPDGFTVTASGMPTESDTQVVWDTGIEVPFATFSVAEYETTRIDWKVPIELSLSPDSPKRAKWEEDIPVMLDFLESIFGPFPYQSLGISAINGKTFAFSAPMRILIPEDMPRFVLVHELAHQWAGNGVTSVDEAAGWIWEGVATYIEILFSEHEGGDLEQLSTALLNRLPDETRPLDDVDEPADLLDQATYQRGAAVYHALRLKIGDEAFFAALREFIQRNLHNTAEVKDLQAVAEEMSGEDLSEFFTAWIEEPAVPDVPQ